MRATLRLFGQEFAVSSSDTEPTLDYVMATLIVPVLLAAGYQRETIDSCIKTN